jgi:hypothetical protein
MERITMDWARAIERNRDALIGIVAALFAMLGLQDGGSVGRIERALHRAVLRVLTPAESAVRRLIVIAARGLVVKPTPARPKPQGPIAGKGGNSRPSLPLFERRHRFDLKPRRTGPRPNPRLHGFNEHGEFVTLWSAFPPAALKPKDDGRIDAGRLCRRLEALKLALADLPRQARRLVRLRARRDKVPSLQFLSPLRPGRAPGSRRKPSHEVDEVLKECHWLAWEATRLDTS